MGGLRGRSHHPTGKLARIEQSDREYSMKHSTDMIVPQPKKPAEIPPPQQSPTAQEAIKTEKKHKHEKHKKSKGKEPEEEEPPASKQKHKHKHHKSNTKSSSPS